ncbi:hypothetical protein ACHAW5_002797 [Stephanodiscus triporus]|uniref:Arf-GAP domain-containing protein n=1 Tax=Stephanodiscus triporus TaxID=2934178 RepID=A0ABD3Q7R6_9STRA
MSQADFRRRLKVLMLRPENQVCSDCPERQPRWASLIKPPPGSPPGTLSMGAFVCLECSGSHRRLGVHISFVRSVNLDQWTEKEVLFMENGGNAKVNAIFEAFLNVAKPTQSASGQVRERFVRDKYERRKFYDPNAFAAVESEREQNEVVSGVQQRLANSRAPSDAARKRVEERAARNHPSGGEGGTATRSNIRAVKTPSAPARVADLLDFGDFTSTEATSAVQASAVTASPFGVTNSAPGSGPTAAPPVPQASHSEPELDLFANMTVENNVHSEQQPGQQQQPTEQKKMTTDDIMSMFNTPSAQHNPMPQNMFPVSGVNGANMAMMNGMHPQQMAMMNGMIPQQQMAMMNGMIPQQHMGMINGMNPQQQMGMINNVQMMQMQSMMGQHGMNNLGGNINMGFMGGQNMGVMGGNNMNMMQQSRMMQGGEGMMQGGNNYGQQSHMMGQAKQLQQEHSSPQQQQRGGAHSNHQAFADFGNFGR